jgi:YidC/Oxa1 family membrane protein insertase
MDLQRLFLFLIFVFSLGLVWDGWQRHQYPERYTQQSEATNEALPKPQISPPATFIPANQPPAITAQAVITPQPAQQVAGKTIHIKTDILEAEISTIGGDISRLALLKHPDALDKNKPLVLFNRGAGTHNYVAQSGLLGDGLPNHTSLFVSEQDQYALSGNAEQVQVRLKAEGNSALKVTKMASACGMLRMLWLRIT